MAHNPIAEKMAEGAADGVYPGAVLLIAYRGEIIFHEPFGRAAVIPKPVGMTRETCFDLASLTKPVATAAAIALLQQEGGLRPDDPLARYLPAFSPGEKKRVTLAHLLNHASGLPAWRPYYKAVAARDALEPGFSGSDGAKRMVYDLACREDLTAPPGRRACYSDVGFILLGAVVEAVSGMPFDRFCETRIFSKRAGEAPFFILVRNPPAETGRRHFAATAAVPRRGGVIRGVVHDDNAYAMGGAAGHAGLFATALGLYHAVRAWIDPLEGSGGILSPAVAGRYTAPPPGAPAGSSWGLGWDTPSRPPAGTVSSSGRFFSAQSFGHLGFTGTSVWVDLKHRLIVILLTNRVHPETENDKIRAFRPALHDIVFKAVVGG